jgi:multiple sugar transport system substrate-binding protein
VATAMREGLTQTAAQAEDTQWSRVERLSLIAQDKVGIVMDGSWCPSFWKPGGVSPWPNWSQTLGTAAFPTQHGQPPGKVNLSGGWTLALGARTAHTQAAFQFVTTAMNQKNSAAIVLACSWLPVRKDGQADPRVSQSDPTEPFWAGLLPITRYRPALPRYPEVSDTMQIAGESVVNGGDPNQAAQRWADAVVRVVGSGATEAG